MNIEVVKRLTLSGWKVTATSEWAPRKVHASAVEVLTREALEQPDMTHKIVATKELPGGHVTIEVEAKNQSAAFDEMLQLCMGVVVTE